MTRSNDPYELQRFVDAQSPVYEQVRSELKAGRKQGHWMWFIFPQLKGLGHSEMANRYSISSLDEARAYLTHSVLGPRLMECGELVQAIEGKPIGAILGYPDDLKFRSSATLFALVDPGNGLFKDLLQKYFDGQLDERTVQSLKL